MLANLQGFTWAHSSAAARLLRIFVEKRVAKERQNFLERGTQELNPNTLFPETPITGNTQQLGNFLGIDSALVIKMLIVQVCCFSLTVCCKKAKQEGKADC